MICYNLFKTNKKKERAVFHFFKVGLLNCRKTVQKTADGNEIIALGLRG